MTPVCAPPSLSEQWREPALRFASLPVLRLWMLRTAATLTWTISATTATTKARLGAQARRQGGKRRRRIGGWRRRRKASCARMWCANRSPWTISGSASVHRARGLRMAMRCAWLSGISSLPNSYRRMLPSRNTSDCCASRAPAAWAQVNSRAPLSVPRWLRARRARWRSPQSCVSLRARALLARCQCCPTAFSEPSRRSRLRIVARAL